MLVYSFNILNALRDKGFSTYRIRKDKLFTEAQLQQIRDNKLLTQEALNKLCKLLNCQPGDLLEYVPDEEVKEETTQKEVPIKKDEEIKNTSKDEIQKEQKEEIPKQVTVKEMKKVAQKNTPIKLKLKKPGNKNKNIL